MPAPAQPLAIELAYTVVLRQVVGTLRALINKHVAPHLSEIASKEDALYGRVANGFKIVRERVSTTVESVVPKIEDASIRIDKFNKREVAKVIGITVNKTIEPRLDAWRQENVDLVTSVVEDSLVDLEATLDESFGLGVDEIATRISERFGVAESRAELIARDQVLKLNGELTQARQEDAGVVAYVWRTVRDARTRDSHAALDGTRQRWSAPPVVSEDGRREHPGRDFQCRCFPEPVLPE